MYLFGESNNSNHTMQQTLLTQRIFCAALAIASAVTSFAQSVTEVTAIRLYEHHSTDMTDQPLGSGADGSKSGYDFVQRRYFDSFDPGTPTGEYANGEEANIDMVEHNGPFGNGSSFLGFTSGVSSIWNGEIKGNGTTRWMKAPSNFDYAGINSVTQISSAYNASQASIEVANVQNNDVYIGKIRGGSLFVVIKCYNVKPAPQSQGTMASIYFDFDYKYGTLATGLNEIEGNTINIYPNPANDRIVVNLQKNGQLSTVKVVSLTGAVVLQPAMVNNSIDISTLSKGFYFLEIETVSGERMVKRLIKE
jgi:hypothetical protein